MFSKPCAHSNTKTTNKKKKKKQRNFTVKPAAAADDDDDTDTVAIDWDVVETFLDAVVHKSDIDIPSSRYLPRYGLSAQVTTKGVSYLVKYIF